MGAVGGFLIFWIKHGTKKKQKLDRLQVLMAVFLYNLYIFVWTSHSDLTYIPGLCV